MDHEFCVGCNFDSKFPVCAVKSIPKNIHVESIINNCDEVSFNEIFVCHKTAQNLTSGRLHILSECDDCGICQLLCPHSKINYTSYFNSKLEDVIFSNLGIACIFFQTLFPESFVATEVQVQGNYRSRRIDLVIKKRYDFYFIKLLKTPEKYSFYKRSYSEVIELYHTRYPDLNLQYLCLIPTNKTNEFIRSSATDLDLVSLYNIIRGK